MEAVGDLDGVGGTLTTTLCICASSIANDNLHTGMTPQPIGEDFGSPLIDQVDRAVRLEVYQERAVPSLTSAQGNIRGGVSGLTGTPAERASRAPPSPPACSANVLNRLSATTV